MITCKEDLVNTYIDHTNSELFSAWFELVKDIVEKDGVNILWLKQNKYCSVESGESGELFVNSIDGVWLKGKRELTLSDLKPRTKVEYEKVQFEPNEIWKAFKEHQEVGYLYVNTHDGFECLFDGVFNLAMAISQGDQLYRKVERQVEWWEDAVEYIRSLNGEANAIDFTDAESDGKKMAINISVVLDERQAKDFARILLEQEGE